MHTPKHTHTRDLSTGWVLPHRVTAITLNPPWAKDTPPLSSANLYPAQAMKRMNLCSNPWTLKLVCGQSKLHPLSQVPSFSKSALSVQIHFLFHLDCCNNLLPGSNLTSFPSLCCQSGFWKTHLTLTLPCFQSCMKNTGVPKEVCTRLVRTALLIPPAKPGVGGARVHPWGMVKQIQLQPLTEYYAAGKHNS